MLQKFLKKIRANPNHPINNKLVKECSALDNMKKNEDEYYKDEQPSNSWCSTIFWDEYINNTGETTITRSEDFDTYTIINNSSTPDRVIMNPGEIIAYRNMLCGNPGLSTIIHIGDEDESS